MRIDDVLRSEIEKLPDCRVKEAMMYSAMAGGKRIRPNLLYEVLKGYGIDETKGDAFAAGIEMIQTYSLIHDDLPDMDNDDLRRGKPTCHKQFDNATAILAGDGLLTYAFETAAKSDLPAEVTVKGIRILAEMAGAGGMVLGQDLDIRAENGLADFEQLRNIEKYKTGCLLSAPLMIGACIAGKDDATIGQWHEAGELIGLAFQVQDDILDLELTAEEFGKSTSDERNDKVTSISLLGENEARSMMKTLYKKGKELIAAFEGFQSEQLIEMIEQIETRRK